MQESDKKRVLEMMLALWPEEEVIDSQDNEIFVWEERGKLQ